MKKEKIKIGLIQQTSSLKQGDNLNYILLEIKHLAEKRSGINHFTRAP